MALRVGILVSGHGSNLESILRSVNRGHFEGTTISVVISNRPEAKALKIAAKFGVPAVCIDDKETPPDQHASKVAEELLAHGVKPGKGLVLLAGYMKILPKSFVELYAGRIMNIHPSLLPAFPGKDAQKQALAHGVKVSGCTVHFVVPQVDSGPIIIQKAVEVKGQDNEDSLSSRILRQEHRIYPEALRLFSEGRLRIQGRTVLVSR